MASYDFGAPMATEFVPCVVLLPVLRSEGSPQLGPSPVALESPQGGYWPALCGGDWGSDHTPDTSVALEKTQLCKYFMKRRCKRGDACRFAHGAEQLRRRPDLYRTELCAGFVSHGSCAYGPRCRFAHSVEELRPVGASKPPPMRHSSPDTARTDTCAKSQPREPAASPKGVATGAGMRHEEQLPAALTLPPVALCCSDLATADDSTRSEYSDSSSDSSSSSQSAWLEDEIADQFAGQSGLLRGDFRWADVLTDDEVDWPASK